MFRKARSQHKQGGALHPVPPLGGVEQDAIGRTTGREWLSCRDWQQQAAHVAGDRSFCRWTSFTSRPTVSFAGKVRQKCVMQLAVQGWGGVAGDTGSGPCPRQRASA